MFQHFGADVRRLSTVVDRFVDGAESGSRQTPPTGLFGRSATKGAGVAAGPAAKGGRPPTKGGASCCGGENSSRTSLKYNIFGGKMLETFSGVAVTTLF